MKYKTRLRSIERAVNLSDFAIRLSIMRPLAIASSFHLGNREGGAEHRDPSGATPHLRLPEYVHDQARASDTDRTAVLFSE